MKTLETRNNKALVVIKTLSNVFGESRKKNYFHFIIIFGEHSSDLCFNCYSMCFNWYLGVTWTEKIHYWSKFLLTVNYDEYYSNWNWFIALLTVLKHNAGELKTLFVHWVLFKYIHHNWQLRETYFSNVFFLFK